MSIITIVLNSLGPPVYFVVTADFPQSSTLIVRWALLPSQTDVITHKHPTLSHIVVLLRGFVLYIYTLRDEQVASLELYLCYCYPNKV